MVRSGPLKMPIPSLRGVLNLVGGNYILILDKAKPSVRVGWKATGIAEGTSNVCHGRNIVAPPGNRAENRENNPQPVALEETSLLDSVKMAIAIIFIQDHGKNNSYK